MLFNSISFLFLFLPTLGFVLKQRAIRLEKKKILILFSLFFYLMVGLENFVVLIVDVFWVYFILSTKRRITVLRASVACTAPIFFLIIAKYSNLIYEVNSNFNLVTVGVSFFTFQLIAYCFDRIKPGCEILGLKDLMLFISFFPQLIAGPIVRVSKVKIFYKKLNLFKPSFIRLKVCFLMFLIGISSKVIFADNLAEIVNKHKIIQSDFGILNFLLICYTYSLQIYLDYRDELMAFYNMQTGNNLASITGSRAIGIRNGLRLFANQLIIQYPEFGYMYSSILSRELEEDERSVPDGFRILGY